MAFTPLDATRGERTASLASCLLNQDPDPELLRFGSVMLPVPVYEPEYPPNELEPELDVIEFMALAPVDWAVLIPLKINTTIVMINANAMTNAKIMKRIFVMFVDSGPALRHRSQAA